MASTLARRFTAWLAVASLAAVTALPLVAAADDGSAAPAEYHYSTAITTAYGSPYPIAGHLDLEIFSNGILRGYYHNAFQKAFIPVTGGRDGNYIWFDIGPPNVDLGLGVGGNGRVHIVATMSGDGSFRGQLFPRAMDSSFVNTNPADASTNSFAGQQGYNSAASYSAANGTPAGDDQYIFAAKQIEKSAEDYPTPIPTP